MNDILIGKGERPVHLLAKYGNRHGLVAGATGTGKTVSLMVLAEGFSRIGVPVFIADVKGDVAGAAMPGTPNEKIQQRVRADRRRGLRARGESRRVLGSLRQGRPPGSCHGQRDRSEPARAGSSSSTTPRPACSRSPSSWPTTAACCCSTSTTCARCSTFVAEQPQGDLQRSTGSSAPRRLPPSSARCCRSSARAARASSASRRSSSPISCAPISAAAASSASSPPTSSS